MDLTVKEKIWVQAKWSKIRALQTKADEAGHRWHRINGEINDHMDRKGLTDIVDRTRRKSESIPLQDALDTGKWHSAEAIRHIEDVQLFLRLKELDLI